MNYELDRKFESWLSLNKERIIESWMELIRIPSITSEPCENAPFGESCAKALSFAAELFNSPSIDCKVYSQGGYALAKYGEGKNTIGIFSHSDVVPVGDGWIFTQPFNPIIKNGSLIGRGAEDNKSGIMAALCLTEFFRDEKIELNSTLQTFIGSDEECGMKDLEAYLKEQPVPEISFVPDADFPCSIGEKGIYHFMVKSKNPFSQIIDISGGEAYNIVLDKVRLTADFHSKLYDELRAAADDSVIELTGDGKVITAEEKGIAKHASIPEGSVNAAFELFCKLLKCDSLCENDRKIIEGAAEALRSYYGDGLNISHEDENFGKLTCVNGMVKTENRHLMLSFDVRYGDSLDAQVLESNADKALAELGFDVVYKNNSPGFSIEKNSPVPEILEGIYAEITGENLKSVLMSGGTYARKLKNAFSIGTFVVDKNRTAPYLEMPEGHGGPHQCDERIDIEGFFTAVRILVHYVYECDKLFGPDSCGD